MNLELSKKQFRLLVDLVYVGNWILNSIRADDRITEYDEVESLIFSMAEKNGLPLLAERADGVAVPSRAFAEGGIHEAIMDYEDTVFFEILAEELARRDLQDEGRLSGDNEELMRRIREYISEFEQNGTDNILVDI